MHRSQIHLKGPDQEADQSLPQNREEQGPAGGDSGGGVTLTVCALTKSLLYCWSRSSRSGGVASNKKSFLSNCQLTCMYNHIRNHSDATSFDLYPPDMLLYYEWVDWKLNCGFSSFDTLLSVAMFPLRITLYTCVSISISFVEFSSCHFVVLQLLSGEPGILQILLWAAGQRRLFSLLSCPQLQTGDSVWKCQELSGESPTIDWTVASRVLPCSWYFTKLAKGAKDRTQSVILN